MKLLFLADVSGSTAHVGDEAMLEANLSLFRRLLPGCVIEVAAGPGWDAGPLAVRTVQRLEFSQSSEDEREALLEVVSNGELAHPAIDAALSCDALVISGGGNLSRSWPHYIYERLAMARLAVSRGVPVFLLGQTLGPQFRPRERILVAELLRSAAWVGVRETYSYALALELGIDRNLLSYQVDDAAFLTPEAIPQEILEGFGLTGKRPFIAVTVHPIGDASISNPVVAKFAAALKSIAREAEADLVFLPHVKFYEQVDTPNDGSFGEAIGRALFANPPLGIAPVFSAAQTLWLTQQAALVISTRYHPLVFALAAGVPTVGVWSDEYTRWKLQGALIHAGRPTDALPLEEALDGRLVSKAIELWRSRDSMREERLSCVDAWLQAEEARFAKLQCCLRKHVPHDSFCDTDFPE